MSANIADNSCAVYAVVDKTKKRRRNKQEYPSESTNFGVYSLVEAPRATDDNKAKLERFEAEANYTAVAGENNQNLEICSVLERENVSSHLKNKASSNVDKENNKVQKISLVCLIVFIMFLLVLLIIALIAVSANFNSEISTIKAKLSHMEAELANNNSQALLDQSSKLQSDALGNQSLNFIQLMISAMELNRAITELNSSYSLLEDSVISSESKLQNKLIMLNSTYNILDERMNFVINALFASSCEDLFTKYATFSSGYYFLRLSNGSFVEVYCSNSCGNVPGGWMRVASLKKLNGRAQCFRNFSNYDGNEGQCVKTSQTTCSSVFFPVLQMSYMHICGTVQGFGYNTPDGFLNMNIDGAYVDGISLTYGSPRHHIWTFAAKFGGWPTVPISCNDGSNFVSPNYSCMKSTNTDNCPVENKCSPDFIRTLEDSTSDDIEMRVCRDQDSTDEEIILDDVELYIH